MARIFMEGFEAPPYLPPEMLVGSGVISSTRARTGSYCLQLRSNSTITHTIDLPEGHTELFFRWAICPVVYHTARFWVLNDTGQQIAYLTMWPGSANSITPNTLSTTQTLTYPVPALGTWTVFELHVKMHANEGLVELRIDSQPLISLTGNTLGTGTQMVDAVLYSYGTGGSIREYCWDDLAINDLSGAENNSWCGMGGIAALHPNGAGDVTEWADQAGSQAANYAAVDETPADGDTTYVRAMASGLTDLYTLSAPAPDVEHVIKAVKVSAAGRSLLAGDSSVQVGARLNGQEVWADPVLLGVTYKTLRGLLMDRAPDGTAWTPEKLAALQVGIRSGES